MSSPSCYETPLGGAVVKVPRAGGVPTVLWHDGRPHGLAVDGGAVVFAVEGGGTNPGKVLRVPLAGGAPTNLSEGDATPWAVARCGTTLIATALAEPAHTMGRVHALGARGAGRSGGPRLLLAAAIPWALACDDRAAAVLDLGPPLSVRLVPLGAR